VGLQRLLETVTVVGDHYGWATRARGVRAEVDAALRDQIGPDHGAILEAIEASFPDEGVVVKDSTMPAYFWGNRLLRVHRPRSTLRPVSMAIGPGLPLAIGAALATDAPTLLIQGDGGFMLSLGELATVVENRLPLIICLFNDGGYGILRWMQDQAFGGRHIGVDLRTPDFVQLAGSFGMGAEKVSRAEDFSAALKRALQAGGPMLLEIDARNLRPVEVRPSQPVRS
jgi:acetolactate synthase-1/2/3 large subunit